MSETATRSPCTIVTIGDVLRRRSAGGNGLEGAPAVSTGVVAHHDLVRRLSDRETRGAFARVLLLYDARGVVLPMRGTLDIAAGAGQRPAYAASPRSLAYGIVGDMTPDVDATLGMTSAMRYLQAHYRTLSRDGWWTALLDNRIIRL